jgi:flagellar FliL protein
MATAPKPAAKTPAKGAKGAAAPVVEDDGAAKALKKKRMMIAGAGVLGLTLVGAGGFYFMKKRAAKEESGDEDVNGDGHEPEKVPKFMVLEPFTVNLRSEGSEQFLQASFNLQVNDQKQEDQLKLYMPQLRSRMLLLLASKTAAEISTAEGKQDLVDEIAKTISQPYVENGKKQAVIGVFITTFVIQ